MPDSTSPPNPLHPQARSIGKNRLNSPKKEKGALPVTPPAPTPASTPPPRALAPIAPVASTPTVSTLDRRTLRHDDPPGAVSKPPSTPGKDLKRFEITVSINGSSEPPFVVDVALTGNGANDQAAARALAKKKFPGRAMTVISSRIFTITENALTEIAPGSTLSSLFGATGGVTEDLIEVGRAFYDGSRGTLFLRNLRSHVGLTFRPGSGGLAVFSNRIVSNRLASELPVIVSEILGNNAREIEIYLKP